MGGAKKEWIGEERNNRRETVICGRMRCGVGIAHRFTLCYGLDCCNIKILKNSLNYNEKKDNHYDIIMFRLSSKVQCD